MDQRALQQFVTLADTLHFGRAAERCHISASALSRSIRQLEEAVGVPLFERDNRSVELTAAGRDFLGYARDAVHAWDTLRQQLQERAGELSGEVSMYCSVTASYSFLYELLSEFRRNHPRIEIKLHTGDPEQAMAHVLAGREDIAIGARPDVMPSSLAFRPIATTPLVFIAPRDRQAGLYTLPGTGSPDWSVVPMILSESGQARDRVDDWFRSREVTPTIYAQVAGNEAIVSMVSLGFGVGVVPRIVLENSPLAGSVQVLRVSPELPPYEVGLFALEKKLRSPLINAFWSG